jgi:5-methylcytosine-specific restriction enzyme subunit McrC
MNGVSIFEYDVLVSSASEMGDAEGQHQIPAQVFSWLEDQCVRGTEERSTAWLRPARRRGERAVQVTSYVGVIRAPNGFQIEVLPKSRKTTADRVVQARKLLIDMLRSLVGFRHIRTASAMLSAERMPLLEVFIAEFLGSVEQVVKAGLRSDYTSRQDHLFTLRGKLLIAGHLRQNLVRADRFLTEHDEFTPNRPENRLLKVALLRVLRQSSSQANQKLARELGFVFADVPASEHVVQDFQKVRLDRGMGNYSDALAWARLILNAESPLSGIGKHMAPSLLFPMNEVFEAFVARHLAKQLTRQLVLKVQARSEYLVRHLEQQWFRLSPDLLVRDGENNVLVLDTKWKLLDSRQANGSGKYNLAQNDFYQLQAYGQSYLHGRGDVVLIYPRTPDFALPLPPFDFATVPTLRLWVVPFCLDSKRLILSTNPLFPTHCFAEEI